MRKDTPTVNEQKMKRSCKEILKVYEKESPQFACKSKTYKKRFLEISQQTVVPFSDVAALFFEIGESDLGAEWINQTLHGAFLHSNMVMQGFVIQLTVEQITEMARHLTEQSIKTAKTSFESKLDSSQNNFVRLHSKTFLRIF